MTAALTLIGANDFLGEKVEGLILTHFMLQISYYTLTYWSLATYCK